MNNLDNYLPRWNISAAIIFLLRWWEWGESAEEAGKTAITVSILLHNICFKKNEGNILGQVCNTRKEFYCMKMAVSKNHLFKGVRSGILRRKETPSSQHTAGCFQLPLENDTTCQNATYELYRPLLPRGHITF